MPQKINANKSKNKNKQTKKKKKPRSFLPSLTTTAKEAWGLVGRTHLTAAIIFPPLLHPFFICIWAELTAAPKREKSTIYLCIKSTIMDLTQPSSWIFKGGVMRRLVVKQKTENQRDGINILIFFNAKIRLRKTMDQWPCKVAVVD